jgi:capsular exopolysaccharide synthesis family protein
MSKFFKALEQAKRDRALHGEAAVEPVRLTKATPETAPHLEAPVVESHPTGGSIAPFPTADSGDVDEHLVSLVTPAAFEAEQYRSLRHSIEHLHATAGLKVIAVSSPAMGDGKTITTINLAGALAQAAEARVLLIDADLRRPALGRLLSLGGINGGLVGGILDARLTLDQIVEPRPPFNLSVVCAGYPPQGPYELLKSPRLGDLLDAARQQFDFVVIDTPPLTPIQDCRVIGRWVDGFLLVVAAHRTPRRLVEEALTTLDPAKVIGIVFNEADRPHSRHYFDYYGGRHFPDEPSSNGRAGALKRAVTKVGNSLRRHRGPASVSRERFQEGRK